MADFDMVSVSDAKIRLHELVARAARRAILLLRHSRPEAVIISYERWLALQEEIEDLRDRVALYRRRTAPADLRLTHAKLKAELGLMPEDETKS